MYLWNIKKLREDLKENRVSSREKMKYFLVFMLVVGGSFYVGLGFGDAGIPYGYTLFEALAFIIITIAGMLVCYQANKQGDDKEFIERFICIGFPIGIRISVFYLIFFICFEIFFYMLSGETYPDQRVFFIESMMLVAFECVDYLWVYKELRIISGTEKFSKQHRPTPS